MDFQNKKQKGLHSNFQILLDLKQGFFSWTFNIWILKSTPYYSNMTKIALRFVRKRAQHLTSADNKLCS